MIFSLSVSADDNFSFSLVALLVELAEILFSGLLSKLFVPTSDDFFLGALGFLNNSLSFLEPFEISPFGLLRSLDGPA